MAYRVAVGRQSYVFADLKELMAKATPLRSGDRLAGLAAGSTELRRTVDKVRAHEPAPSLECFVHPPFTSTGSGGIPHGIQEDLADPAWRANLRAARDLGVQRFSIYN